MTATHRVKILSVRTISGKTYFYQPDGETVYQDRGCKQEIGRIKQAPTTTGSNAVCWWVRPAGSAHKVPAHGMSKHQAVEHLASIWDLQEFWRSNPARLGRSLTVNGKSIE